MTTSSTEIVVNSSNLERAAYVMAQAALLQCRVAGMVAENQQRDHLDESVAYDDDAFLEVEREFQPLIGHEALVELFGKEGS